MASELVLRDPRVPRPGPKPVLINIYHPGYHDEFILLMSFPGYDSRKGHLWHNFAHTACAIISNNRFDGWLSRSRDPQSIRFSGDLLEPGDYWWHLPGGKSESFVSYGLLLRMFRFFSAICHHSRFPQLAIPSALS